MVLWVFCMLSAITLVWYMSAHIRFDIDAALGSSFSILAALLVDETLIRSTPFKFLSSHISHCPNACPSVSCPKVTECRSRPRNNASQCNKSRSLPEDANISAQSPSTDNWPTAHAAPAQTPLHKPSNCRVSSLETNQKS